MHILRPAQDEIKKLTVVYFITIIIIIIYLFIYLFFCHDIP